MSSYFIFRYIISEVRKKYDLYILGTFMSMWCSWCSCFFWVHFSWTLSSWTETEIQKLYTCLLILNCLYMFVDLPLKQTFLNRQHRWSVYWHSLPVTEIHNLLGFFNDLQYFYFLSAPSTKKTTLAIPWYNDCGRFRSWLSWIHTCKGWVSRLWSSSEKEPMRDRWGFFLLGCKCRLDLSGW